jgi:hypothetical protein
MARSAPLSIDNVAQALRAAGPGGLTPEELQAQLPSASRSTLTRRLAQLHTAGEIKIVGRGRAIRYVALAAYSLDEVRRYFEADWQSRPAVGYQEQLLAPAPGLAPEVEARLIKMQRRAQPLDRKFLSDFLIDFSWASSVLEGSTYSSIDTQALIEYGERNPEKPTEDAVLILNHKNAIQHLWTHRELTTGTLCQLQAFLTDDHGLEEVQDADHFLPANQRGVPREFQEVRLGRSAYNPPFRPATGYIAQAFAQIVETAKTLPPVASALYLMTRIPYLQVFANGNKRTARLAANIPLLAAGLLPISFVDFRKADYILGMSAFYELGDIEVIQQVFVEGYVRSIVRGSDVPAAVRLAGASVERVTPELIRYVRTGQTPRSEAAIFLT